MIPASPPAVRELSFEQRVEAQEAIERVYYAHQIGATLPFEQAVPRALIEKKVRNYLKASAALETWWSTEVTAAALQREAQRMARDSRLPGRLIELHAALHHDSFLIQECLARPALVNRLARRFFADDDRIHVEARRQAAELGPVTDEGDRFVVLGPASETARVLAKRAWEDWWLELEDRFDESKVAAVADGTWMVPRPVQAAGCDPQGTWLTGGLEDSPDPTYTARAVWTGSEMIVWGGSHPARHRYDPATDSWSAISILGAPNRTPALSSETSLAWTGTIVLAWGGIPSKSGRYNPSLDAWQPVSAVNAPTGTTVSVWTGTQLLVWGGSDASNKRYDPIADVWSNMSTLGQPPVRNIPSLVWTGSEMILWGGYRTLSGLANYQWPGGRYNPTTDTWSPMSDVGAPSKREQHSAVWTGTRMVIWGGAQQAPPPPGPPPSFPLYNFDTSAGLYDPQTDTWAPVSPVNAPSPRLAQMTVWTGSRMIVWGGLGGAPYSNTGAIYDPVANLWTPISPTNAPGARAYSATVWTGNEMILWGGAFATPSQMTKPTATGGRYDPSSNTWTPIGLTGAPQARTNHTAVWTGNEMIVWGGSPNSFQGSTEVLGSGARFDPALGTWAPVTLVGAPSPRREHTAVWTGSEMIVWGGIADSSGYLLSGARYDPITDTWAATGTTNAPPARTNHSAVWTGSEMVVWGGKGPNIDGFVQLLNTGGLYDPAHDQWTSTATSGAPAGRELHAAVWTGSRMIVWGGGSATGGLYDPVADTWSSMATTPLSVSRDHAVWSGTEMLIWEGTGQRYNPVTDSWSPMSSTTNVTGPYFSMAWTGQEMIVWGGSFKNTGMRYKPATDSWTLTTTANAPWRRDHASAVWAEDAMLVWGGGDTEPMRSGGAYTVPSAADADGDGFLAWDPDAGCERDCDDASPAVFPGATQICGDGLNNDCSHPSWPSLAGTNEGDNDGDGFTACAGDCADASPTVYPGAPQICDHLNNDCSSPLWPTPASADDADVDQDGFALCEGDCNDASMTVYPGAPQICDRLNNDCSSPSWPAVPVSETDGDQDQYAPCEGDCADTNATVHPGAPQVCGDGLNNDCSHPSWPSLAGTNEVDNDGDGLTSCQADCDDADPASWQAPGEALDLRLSAGGVLSWLHPELPGGTALQYDVIRAAYYPLAFDMGVCVESDGGDTVALDTELPVNPYHILFYLVRAQNGCGAGPAGFGSNGSEIPAVTCP